jgi:hypothetical protein
MVMRVKPVSSGMRAAPASVVVAPAARIVMLAVAWPSPVPSVRTLAAMVNPVVRRDGGSRRSSRMAPTLLTGAIGSPAANRKAARSQVCADKVVARSAAP